MTLQVHVHFEKVNTVAPSLLQPSKQLGSRTPMQLVGMSNLKLNREMYSPRAQSIHRRIVIKNFLTMLYQRHPIEWIEDSPVDDKDHWMEQTLSAVGIEEHSDSHQNDNDGDYSYNHNNYDAYDPNRSPSSKPQVPDRLLLKPSKVTPLPRPVSGELPQSLHNYLSNVFDVDWSPDANNSEDSFYTKSSSRPASTSSPALASQLSQLSFSSTTPPPASWTLASERKTKTPQRTRSFTSNGNTGHIDNSPGSLMREPSQDTLRTTNHGRKLPQQEYKSAQATQDPMPQPRPRIRTHALPNHDTIDYNNYRQAGPGQDVNSMQTTPHHYRYDTPQHIHNHIHIHIHNHNHNHNQSNDNHQDTCEHDPSDGLRDNLKRESVSRSPRYPKSPPIVPTPGSKRGARTSNSSTSSTSTSSGLSEESYPHPRQFSKDSESLLDYPPREHTFGSYDRPYLAAPFPDYKEQHYPQSLPPPPPPPYSRSPAPAPLITSPPPSPPIMPPDLKISQSNQTRPSEPTLAKLEYQQYQERQKQFVRDDQGEDPKAGGALGFIKMLSRQGSKKKAPISAPLSNISSISGPLLLQDISRAPLQYPVSANNGHGSWSTKAAAISSKYTHPSTHRPPSPPFSVSSA